MAEKLFASWTHGCSAVCETSSTRALYQGFGATFQIPAGTQDWIHIPIPTPVILNNRAKVQKVFYLFNAAAGARLGAIHIYDGFNRILTANDVSSEGDHSHGIDPPLIGKNFSRFASPPQVFWGLGVSLLVKSATQESRFYISTAGADFLVDV